MRNALRILCCAVCSILFGMTTVFASEPSTLQPASPQTADIALVIAAIAAISASVVIFFKTARRRF